MAVAVANPAKFPARATPSNPHARATPAKLPARATPANHPARATPSNLPARASPAKNPARASSDPVAILFSNSQMNADGSFSYELVSYCTIQFIVLQPVDGVTDSKLKMASKYLSRDRRDRSEGSPKR